MTRRFWLTGMVLLGVAVSAPAYSGQILSPVAVDGNTLGTGGGDVSHLIDRTGLSTGFISGVTDYETYIALGTTHAVISMTNGWASFANKPPGYLEFDLGAGYAISGFALWTQNTILAVNSFTLSVAQDAGFTQGVTNLGTFNAAAGLGVQSFDVTGTGEFVRMEINSSHGATAVNLGEVAFDTEVLPEPGSLALLCVGLAGTGFFGRRRCR